MTLFIVLIVAAVLLITFIIVTIYCLRKKTGTYRLTKNSFTSNAHRGYAGIQNKTDSNNPEDYEAGDSSMDRTVSD